MKTFLLLLLSILTFNLHAQDDVYGTPSRNQTKISKVDSIPFKGAERIIVKNQLNKLENFKLAKSILANEEIELSSSDEDTGQIKSGAISVGSTYLAGANYFVIIFCKENEVSIRSQLKTGISTGNFLRIEDGYQPVVYGNPKRGNVIFDKMKEISSQLKGKIYYSTTK